MPEERIKRISGDRKIGSGDSGYSCPIEGQGRISKGSDATHFYGSCEKLQNYISLVLIEYYDDNIAIQQPEIMHLLIWLEESLHSIQSFYHCWGDSQRHSFPKEFLEYLQSRTKSLWAECAESKDFQSFSSHINLVHLNQIRILIREVEAHFVAWEKSDAMQVRIGKSEELLQRVRNNRICWNRLSSLFWCFIQKERVLLKIRPKYWRGEMPPFNVDEVLSPLAP